MAPTAQTLISRHALAAILLVLGLTVVACTEDPVDMIGEACESEEPCEAIEQGYCTLGGVCTTVCATHEDCGCAAGTTNDGIQSGACWARCVTYTGEQGFCARTCGEAGDCDPRTTCKFSPTEAIGSCL